MQKLGNTQKKSAVEMRNLDYCGPHVGVAVAVAEVEEEDGGDGEVGTQELQWRWVVVG